MKRPYFASRNHSSRFAFAGSGAGRVVCAPGWTTKNPKAATIAKAQNARFIWTSEIHSHRELNDPRRPRRVRDADRRAEVRVDLHAVRVEPSRAVDVLELDRVEQIVDLRAELRRDAGAELHVLEHREIRVDQARFLHDVAGRIAVIAARGPPERRGIEEPGERVAAAGEWISDHDRADEVQTRFAAREARAVARFTAREV